MVTQSHEPVYKQLSTDMREGLKDIYQQLSTASAQSQTLAEPEARTLFREATSQLDEVLRSTEEAATNILELIERHEDNQLEAARLLAELKEGRGTPSTLARLEAMNRELGEDLTTLTLQMSFQDLTGQRIKRVVGALNRIEDTVVNLYITSGLIMEAAENDPGKAPEELKAEAAHAVEAFRSGREASSELKGPDRNGVSQKAIDDMLAQLGL